MSEYQPSAPPSYDMCIPMAGPGGLNATQFQHEHSSTANYASPFAQHQQVMFVNLQGNNNPSTKQKAKQFLMKCKHTLMAVIIIIHIAYFVFSYFTAEETINLQLKRFHTWDSVVRNQVSG